jgi:hypothetical protein
VNISILLEPKAGLTAGKTDCPSREERQSETIEEEGVDNLVVGFIKIGPPPDAPTEDHKVWTLVEGIGERLEGETSYPFDDYIAAAVLEAFKQGIRFQRMQNANPLPE